MASPVIQIVSFRGETFEVIDVGRSGGRRITTTEFPQRDDPYTQDLGRTARRYKFRGFIADPDLAGKKSRLLRALETEGQAVLVHPTDGPLLARCESYEITETSTTLGVVEFSMSFVEDGIAPVAATPASSASATFGAQLRAAVAEGYEIRRQALVATDRVRRILSGNITEQCRALLGLAGQFTGADVTAYVDAVNATSDAASTLIDDTASEVEKWTAVFAASPSSADSRTIVDSLVDDVDDAAAAAALTGLSDQEQATADAVLDAQIMRALLALSYATEGTVAEDWTAADDAIAASNQLADACTALESYAWDADTLSSLADIRTTAALGILDEAASLPQLRTLDVPQPRTAWDLAMDLYGDATRAEEIVTRNGLSDPLWCAGSLQVLTR